MRTLVRGAACAAVAVLLLCHAASPVVNRVRAQAPPAVFVNEIHYDNAGTDAGEFVEIAGPAGTDLSTYAIVLYNGANGQVYATTPLAGVIPNQQDGYGTVAISYPVNGIQNGAPDGLALVAGGTVLQFLSYEGTFTAVDGPAAGRVSTDIGVSEAGTEPLGLSLQLQGVGTSYDEFTWSTPIAHTAGAVNTGQVFDGDLPPPPPPPPPPPAPATNVIINELDSDTPGTDAAEFVELYDGGAGRTRLDGLVVVFYNGSNDLSYAAFDLDGMVTDANGYFVLGNAAVPGVGLVFAGNLLQNGADAVAVYQGDASDFPNNTPVTTIGLLDAIVYDTDDPDDAGLLVLLNAGQPQVNESSTADPANVSNQRCDNGTGGARNTATYRQLAPTPGSVNVCGGLVAARTIPEIQGAGLATPFAGERVLTEGIVTALKSNGFFLQARSGDGDTATSDGIFVFVGSLPAVTPGDEVRVRGTAGEFFNLTQVSAVPTDVTILSRDNPLPGAVELTPAILSPSGPLTQLEPLEGMRVRAASATAISGTNNFGEIFTVLTGTPRPFREPGIARSVAPPAGAPPTVPRFDGNPERLMIDTDGRLGAAAVAVSTGAVFTDVVGPLDFTFSDYKIVPETAPAFTPGMTPQAARDAAADEFTIGSANLLNFSSTASDFGLRLDKISRALREVMRSPDVIGVQEVMDIATLSALAARLNADTVAAGGAFPGYEAILLEGTDEFPGEDIDVGFLVKAARVAVASVTQEGRDLRFLDPSDGTMDILFERPPLVLRATILAPGRAPYPITVVVNHSQSLIDVELNTPRGERQRLKRRLQAEFVANLVQRIQGENLVLVGDFNAYEFNDGYVDVIGTIAGTPAPAAEVTLPTPDLVDPDLTPLVNLLPETERYSYVFGGSAQAIDHVLVDQELLARLRSFLYIRNNADFPIALANDTSTTARVSDHDMALAYFSLPDPWADLSVEKSGPLTVTAGDAIAWTLTVRNDGPDDAQEVRLTDVLPSGAGFRSVQPPAGWTCETPAPGSAGAVGCSAASLPAGATAHVELAAQAGCVADGTSLLNSATIAAATPDPAAANNTAAAWTAVSNPPPLVGSLAVDRAVLDPPNHRMVDVNVAYTLSSACGPVSAVLEVASNEPQNGTGDGDTSPDWEVVDAHRVRLRAERAGTGTGRIYTITVVATGATGGVTRRSVTVAVPKR